MQEAIGIVVVPRRNAINKDMCRQSELKYADLSPGYCPVVSEGK